MKDILSRTAGLEKDQWIKLPCGAWKFFKQCGYTANEFGILLYFYQKLCSNSQLETTIVYATCQEVMNFCCITKRVYFYAIDKMIKKGLVKTGPNLYDFSEFLKNMNIRGEFYNCEEM
jgi:DNA-binding MarR family transcriptional regulator